MQEMGKGQATVQSLERRCEVNLQRLWPKQFIFLTAPGHLHLGGPSRLLLADGMWMTLMNAFSQAWS